MIEPEYKPWYKRELAYERFRRNFLEPRLQLREGDYRDWAHSHANELIEGFELTGLQWWQFAAWCWEQFAKAKGAYV